jgi:hypothetical protein
MKLVGRGLARDAAFVAAALLAACGKVNGEEDVDAHMGTDAPVDASPPDASALGGPTQPAASCAELRDALGPTSAVYWLRHPDPARPAFEAYCEQTLEGGGWALLQNSVHRIDGTTNAFWNILRDDRFKTKGTLSPAENYYQGSLYLVGATEYLDTITDVGGTTATAALVTVTGFDPETMKFAGVMKTSGDDRVVDGHFKAGWSSPDYDGDPFIAPANRPDLSSNCAVYYSNVTQHYAGCWTYSLGSDADEPYLDGGVGPHVNNDTLTGLGLALQLSSGRGSYSQVERIARYTRW